eukprot:gene7100-biopygen10954
MLCTGSTWSHRRSSSPLATATRPRDDAAGREELAERLARLPGELRLLHDGGEEVVDPVQAAVLRVQRRCQRRVSGSSRLELGFLSAKRLSN